MAHHDHRGARASRRVDRLKRNVGRIPAPLRHALQARAPLPRVRRRSRRAARAASRRPRRPGRHEGLEGDLHPRSHQRQGPRCRRRRGRREAAHVLPLRAGVRRRDDPGPPGHGARPLSPPSQPITGDSHAHLLTPLENLAAELGYSVRQLPLDGADGWCDCERREIVVNERLPANAQVRVLVHEVAHSLGVGYKQYGRERAEVLVDTVTYVVLAGQVGLDVGGDSIPYVAGWGEAGELDSIREYAETIDAIARRIEDAILPAAAPVPVDQPRELKPAA